MILFVTKEFTIIKIPVLESLRGEKVLASNL